MGRSIHRLTAVKVNALKRPGYHADGAGLYLKIQDGGSRSWVYRFMLNGRRRDCGLGKHPAISLAHARQLAEDCRRVVASGVDPIEQRAAERAAERAKAANQMTFEQCGREFFGAHEPAWTNAEHRRQWLATLASYVFPLIGPQPVAAVDTAAVLNVLTPIWNEKPETANRIRGRIETVLDWAKTKGYRDGENPARWRGHLQHTLPATRKLQPIVHFAALPYHEVGDLMAALREQTSITARALEFLILTASRAGEVRGARWDEIDVDDSMWVLPPGRMKSGRKHRVPLSPRAIAIVMEMAEVRQSEFVFFGTKLGRAISRNTMTVLVHRMGYECTTHGFRSTFRDWAGECTSFPREIAEAALAHVTGNAVERAYRRGDAFEKRRVLMEQWAVFCERRDSANVIPLRGRE